MFERVHKAFFPPKQNCTIWRYIDFTKFLSLLENRKLPLIRADQFDDPYEGALSRETIRLFRDSKQNGGMPEHVVEQCIRNADQFRQHMFISCWYASEHESAAMWKLHLQSPEGVSIRSDYDALASTLDRSPLKARISMIQYVDYDNVIIPIDNLFFPFVHKRLSFAHEQELRVIVWSLEDVNKPQLQEGATSISIDVRPEELVKSVHVSPVAPKWFGELVEQVLRRYGLGVPVVRSNLYDRPSY
jgi:hypothetical protein